MSKIRIANPQPGSAKYTTGSQAERYVRRKEALIIGGELLPWSKGMRAASSKSRIRSGTQAMSTFAASYGGMAGIQAVCINLARLFHRSRSSRKMCNVDWSEVYKSERRRPGYVLENGRSLSKPNQEPVATNEQHEVEREFREVFADAAPAEARRVMGEDRLLANKPLAEWDATALLKLMWDAWNEVFRRVLGHAERSLISELREVRNKWAHQEPFSTDDAYRGLDSAGRLLTAVSAPQADDIEKMKMELLRVRFDEQVRGEKRKSAGIAIESASSTNLKPWREVVTPHNDVASGPAKHRRSTARPGSVSRSPTRRKRKHGPRERTGTTAATPSASWR
jgi:hypothetical protein